MIHKKIFQVVLLFMICTTNTKAQPKPEIDYFPLQDVRLLESPFKHAQELNKAYLLELDADRLLAPFHREAGLTPKAESYTNWENSGLDGHIGGHYLSALSLMYASTGDREIESRLNYMLDELKRCQQANGNGYIGGVPGSKALWNEIAAGKIDAGGFSLNGRWVPLYNIHKTYAGLRDAYLIAGKEEAREMLVAMSDWAVQLTAGLTDEQMQEMLRSEHGGLNEVFADVAAITGEEKYLLLARRFSHRHLLDPLLAERDELTGMHANTQIPKVIGFKRIADLEANESWDKAARFFWETVVNTRTVSIGGNSVSEHFNPPDDFSKMITSIEGPETCNTYNMLKLTTMLYRTDPQSKYIDYYERALYNHIHSTQNPRTGGLIYFTPMRPGHYRVYSQPHTSMWCCVGSGIENHSKYGKMIYAHTRDALYVNLFIPSRLQWRDQQTEILQENNFPFENHTEITMNPHGRKRFTLMLRYPSWAKGEKAPRLMVNGKEYPAKEKEGYLAIERVWHKGDHVVMELPMRVRVEQLPNRSNYYSFFYGPIVLAAKTTDEGQTGLFADDSRGGHVPQGPQIALKEMPLVVGEPEELPSLLQPVAGKPLTFRLTSLYPETYAGGMELIPFFRLHESRYIIYWPQASKEEAVTLHRAIEQEEARRNKLNSITLDMVVCGEQQPESDHLIASENSHAGVFEDTHWREARGWFSYKMRNDKQNARYLYIRYFDNDPSRSFDILVNDQQLESLSLKGKKGSEPQELLIPLPEGMIGAKLLTVKFSALPESSTGKVAEVRLLSDPFEVNQTK